MQVKDKFLGKKVLVMGLGILGGGIATARWAVEQGAQVTVTDLKTEQELSGSIKKLEDIKNKITFVLGEHRDSDFENTDMVIVNPDIPISSPFLEIARKNKVVIENELTLFLSRAPSINNIAVTGTRGKTTTSNWIGHLIKGINQDTLVTGNSSDEPLLKTINRVTPSTSVVVETPSFLLEHFTADKKAPHIAVITNLFQDHLNRHGTMDNYANTKANIYRNQKPTDFLILNFDNDWSNFFLKQNPKAKILFFSCKELPDDKEGAYIKNEKVVIRFKNKEETLIDSSAFIEKHGMHNLENFLASSLTAYISGVSAEKIHELSITLPEIHFRQEKVYDRGGIKIYNDTNATSPEGAVAAIRRFRRNKKNTIFISGGTDLGLDFSKWAEEVQTHIAPKYLILLSGSATEKMKKNLAELKYEPIQEYETLDECFKKATEIMTAKNGEWTVVFSPASKSFEKFKNEFDRGEKFNEIIKSYGFSN
jgi:UDP-N-acetylmuramoylalanine--D-glutamate ligase